PADGGGRGAVRAVPRLPPQPDFPAHAAQPQRRAAAALVVGRPVPAPVPELTFAAGRPAGVARRPERRRALSESARVRPVRLPPARERGARLSGDARG